MLACQAPLDVTLSVVQPVQRPVQIIGAALAQPQHAPQRRGGRVLLQHAVRGELRGRLQHARHQHRLQQRLQILRGRSEPHTRTRATGSAEHRRDMAMGQAALDGEDRLGTGYGDTTTQQHLQPLDHISRQAGQVGQGALAYLAGFSVGLAKQDRGGRVAVGDGLDIHGHPE